MQKIGELACGTWPASALDELWSVAHRINKRAPEMLTEDNLRAEWSAKYGHALTEAEWNEILGERISEGCVLVGIRSDAPREARHFWHHEALLRQPGGTRAKRYTAVYFTEEELYRTPYLTSGLTLWAARQDVVSYIFTEGTILPAFTEKKVTAAGGAR